MSDSIARDHREYLDAIAFAARAHRHQLRKDGETPYVSHVFRVCMVLRDVFEITDRRALIAAVLHDTIEDTNTDFDDVEEKFGAEIAGWVAMLSKDKTLPYHERERAYCAKLTNAPWQVQVCKLADVFDNLLDMAYLPPEKHPKAVRNKRQYLNAIKADLKHEAARAFDITDRLCTEIERNTQR
jgi:guanosine-3',5'-bis(diphosphate) 3'-pyrophosphohydrolase